jgi:hypothetical protein
MRQPTPSKEEITATLATATAELIALRAEQESLPAKIETLKHLLLTDASRKPEDIQREIRENETKLRSLDIEIARTEGQRLEALIHKARQPISGLSDDEEKAYVRQDDTAAKLRLAQAEHEAAQQHVLKVQHDLQAAERATQQAEIALAQHRQHAKASIAI